MAMFKFIPALRITGYARFYIVAFENFAIISNAISLPVMLCLFNRDVREHARDLFRKSTTIITIRVTSTKGQERHATRQAEGGRCQH
ncbi:hypothetical protein KIN20_001531 [Parelaphostrongylus tenuis]|uniref:Uncharacterized protein n=1 Tax=Parelaphostrongylus tenuis TaxID=148309 RepID=A0AAD5LW93_PARTN|nr:hypothetical protein KIN20_001531 [Parelaphostrongylus tenuis]